MSNKNKHENYEILNLIGYGLAKFDLNFIKEFGYKTKQQFYEYIVSIGIAETSGTVKNRQDLFDPFFDNKRKGWWQKGNTYIHRKILIDSLFGEEDCPSYVKLVKLYIQEKFSCDQKNLDWIQPITKSKFKQLQDTGIAAELFFLNNYQTIDLLANGEIYDGRTFGDGYDFQINVNNQLFLAEVKGIRRQTGSFRMTNKEYEKAKEYKDNYGLFIVSNLEDMPKISCFLNPIETINLTKKITVKREIMFHSQQLKL